MNNKYTFSDNDYLSGDGMMTTIWGPPLWHVLHTISFNYPINPNKEQKINYYNFYNNLKNILPCKYCRDNLSNNLKLLPNIKFVLPTAPIINTKIAGKTTAWHDIEDI